MENQKDRNKSTMAILAASLAEEQSTPEDEAPKKSNNDLKAMSKLL